MINVITNGINSVQSVDDKFTVGHTQFYAGKSMMSIQDRSTKIYVQTSDHCRKFLLNLNATVLH